MPVYNEIHGCMRFLQVCKGWYSYVAAVMIMAYMYSYTALNSSPGLCRRLKYLTLYSLYMCVVHSLNQIITPMVCGSHEAVISKYGYYICPQCVECSALSVAKSHCMTLCL